MHRVIHNDLVFYQFETLTGYSEITHGLFTRLGGVSDAPFDTLNVGSTVGDDPVCVRTNRERMILAMSCVEADTRTTWQVHGTDILVARRSDSIHWPPPQADGIITADVGLSLVMRFADCVPLLFFDPARQVVGLCHAGWRGTLLGAGPATIEKMGEIYGCRPQDIMAGIGPSIGPCCYEVGREVTSQAQEALGISDRFVRSPSNGYGKCLDLWAANEHVLRLAGVEHIEVAGICTACNTHEFYSHRAEKGRTGRFGVVLKLKENN
ncbi:MAG: peptidoglycan editing factor PgeF [Anaerolineae bacterium]|nr:peptidoglycan editing factor PgeF [Anaerolineae bacterium]